MSRKRNFSDRMNDAVTDVINQEFSQNKAAKEYEVSREALQRHVKATKEGVSIAKVGRKCEMSKEEETLIAKTVQTVADRILSSIFLKMLVEKLLNLIVSAQD